MRTIKFLTVIASLGLLALTACGGGGGGSGADAQGSGSGAATISITGYPNTATRGYLTLTNKGSGDLEIKNAGFESGSADFWLEGWRAPSQGEVLSSAFTGLTLRAGETAIFLIRFMPVTVQTQNSTFVVRSSAGTATYEITAYVSTSAPPVRPGDGGDGDGGDGDGGDGDGGDGDGGDGDGGDGDGGFDISKATPAETLDGDLFLYVAYLYSYINLGNGGVDFNGGMEGWANINFDSETFTLSEVEPGNDFAIETDGGTKYFNGAVFVITSPGSKGDFLESDSIISLDDAKFVLFSDSTEMEDVPDENGVFSLAFTLDLSTGTTDLADFSEIAKDGNLSQGLEDTFGPPGVMSDGEFHGTFPSDSDRNIVLAGCGYIPQDGVEMNDNLLGIAFPGDQLICIALQGQVLQQ